MLTESLARTFAHEWIEAWNSHDLMRIMSHYDKDVEYHSPFLLKLTDNQAGMIQGKHHVEEYFARGLAAYPQLHFTLLDMFVGVRSLVLQYQSVNGLIAAEVFELNDQGLACRVQCHYSKAL